MTAVKAWHPQSGPRRSFAGRVFFAISILVPMAAYADCDPSRGASQISFAKTIEPILNKSCALASCHIPNGPPPHDLVLVAGHSYEHLIAVPSVEADTMRLVEPGNPEASYLIHKLRGTHKEVGGGGARMPFDLDPLTEEQIAIIATWIGDCSPNN